MKEWNCSCVSIRIPKHELDSQAFGNSSENELNLVSSETAFLCSTTSPQDVVSDIRSQRNGSDAKSERALRIQGRICLPQRIFCPSISFFPPLPQIPTLKFKVNHLLDELIIRQESSIRCTLISLISIIKGKCNLPFKKCTTHPMHLKC